MKLDNFNLIPDKTVDEHVPIVSKTASGYSSKYKEFCRPKLGELLESLKLDKSYHKASGNYLYYYKSQNNDVSEIPVLDFVSGYGTNLLGHNHPDLAEVLKGSIEQKIPFTAQGATRPYAALLAERLNQLTVTPDNSKYYCNLTNSGTEAVEAAIKHAYMVWSDNTERKITKLQILINDFFNEIQERINTGELNMPDTTVHQIKKDIYKYNKKQINRYLQKAVICAFKGSFHGKTTSSVKVTYNKTFRRSFENLTTFRSEFIDIHQPDKLNEIHTSNKFSLLYPVLENNTIEVREEKFSLVFAFIMEVILGEGGVITVPDDTFRELAVLHENLKIPFIIDEIQTGCGRTGSFYSYTKTPLKNISPEYITLSKALGGGLVKVGATLINERVYDPEFGLLHTSTFSEDDISSLVAMKAIDIITGNNNALLKKIELKGQYILGQLEKLKSKYPHIIKSVRGKGLMIGLEFTDLSHYGPFFRYAGTQGFIAMMVASYILEYFNIRLLSPLSTMFKGEISERRKSVLRLQPSAYIKEHEIDLLLEALDETFNIIDHNNEFILLAHLVDYDVKLLERKYPITVKKDEREIVSTKADIKIGFIVHITELDYLINHYLRSFNHYEYRRRSLIKWWNKLCRFLESDLMHQTYLTIQNKKIEVNIISLPYLPKHMIRTLAEGLDKNSNNRISKLNLLEMQDKIQDAAEYVKHIGNKNVPVRIIGLGAYNSIVTKNALHFNDLEFPVTSGNTYTTALMYQGILKAVAKKEIDIFDSTVAIVGAGGNIGRAISELFSPLAKKLILIGRETEESKNKLQEVKKLCYQFIEPHMKKTSSDPDNEPITIGSLKDTISADIVVIATNSSDTNLITPDNVKPGAIVCCASVPSNLSESFKNHRDEFFVFDSGYAKLPDDNSIDSIGMPKDGMVYGCLGETILVALSDYYNSFSKGHITSAKIIETLNLADDFGFELGKFVLGDHIKRMVT